MLIPFIKGSSSNYLWRSALLRVQVKWSLGVWNHQISALCRVSSVLSGIIHLVMSVWSCLGADK